MVRQPFVGVAAFALIATPAVAADIYTSNLNLTKIEVGASDDTWGDKLNSNADTVDSVFKADATGTSVGLNIGSGKTLSVAGTASFTGSVNMSASPLFTGNTFTISSTAPDVRFTESDQTDPAGRFRIQLNGDTYKLQRAATAAWGSASDVFTVAGSSQVLDFAQTPTIGGSAILKAGNNLSDVASAAASRTNLGLAVGTNVEAHDATLTAFAGMSWSAGVQVPTLTAADTFALKTIGASSGNILDKAAGDSLYQPLDSTLTAWAAYNANGCLAQTAADIFTGRTITGPAAGLTVTNGNCVSGNPTLALANDLSAVEGLSGTGFAVRTASDTWTTRNIGAGTGISITNGDGVAGSPSVAIDTSVVPQLGSANNFTDNQTLTSTDSGNTALPKIIFDRNSASPAASDNMGSVQYFGRDSNGNSTPYATITGQIASPTDTAESGVIALGTIQGGSFTSARLSVGAGMYTTGLIDPGAGKFNGVGYQINNVDLFGAARTISAAWTFSTAPVISTITNTGTLTLPTSSDTLVGRATTDTLTNKTLTSPSLSNPSISGTATYSGDVKTSGSAPTISSCGTSPALGTNATDTAGHVTTGTSTSVCTITFATAKTNEPSCIVADTGNTNGMTYTVSTSAIVVSNTNQNRKLEWICVQH